MYGFGRIWLNGNYVTSRDIEIVLPYHLGDYNKQNKEVYEIGTFCECKLLNDTKKQSYFLINKKNLAVAEWKSIESLIRDCINELITYYNENGKAKAPSIMGKIIFNKIIKQ